MSEAELYREIELELLRERRRATGRREKVIRYKIGYILAEQHLLNIPKFCHILKSFQHTPYFQCQL